MNSCRLATAILISRLKNNLVDFQVHNDFKKSFTEYLDCILSYH